MRLGALEREILLSIMDVSVKEETKPPTSRTLAEALEELRLRAAQAEAVTSPGTQAYENAVAALSHRKPGRIGVKPGEAALIDVRARMWGKDVTPAQRAALSRALRTLSSKGLIRCRGSRRFIVKLTLESTEEERLTREKEELRQQLQEIQALIDGLKPNVNKNAKPVLLTPQGVAP